MQKFHLHNYYVLSDEKIRSLPIPPPYQPKIYEHDPPHANNITNIFKS